MIDYRALKNRVRADVVQTYSERDTMLDALGPAPGAIPWPQLIYATSTRSRWWHCRPWPWCWARRGSG
jgi:hypothetical protein